MPAMPTTPAASPSRPSIRLTALAISATQITVSSGDRSGERTTKPAKGILKNSSVTPSSDRRLPEKTWPASLAGGDTSRRSSRAPTANIVVAPISSPSGSEVPRKTGRNRGRTEATAMAARKPPYIAAPPRVGVGRSWTRRGSGDTTAPRRMATRRTVGVRAQVTRAATARTRMYSAMPAVQDGMPAGTGRVMGDASPGIGRELGAEPGRRLPDLGGHRLVVGGPQHPGDERGDLGHLRLPHAGGGDGGGADPQPAGDERRLGVAGDRVLVERDPGPVEGLLGHLARHPERAQVDQHQMVVGAAGDDSEPLAGQGGGQRPGIADDAGGVVGEARLGRLVEADGLGRDHVHQRPALHPGEDGLVDG